MTKFMTLPQMEGEKKETKKTVFKTLLAHDLTIGGTILTPFHWENVLFIGEDKKYGDVFKAWDSNAPNDYVIFFGEKGDEFPE